MFKRMDDPLLGENPSELIQMLICIKNLIEHALVEVPPYRGECTRWVDITNKNELAYYQVGKVFRF